MLAEIGRPQQSSNKISGTATKSPISRNSFLGQQNVNQTSATGSFVKEINQNIKVEIDYKTPTGGDSEQKMKDYFDKQFKLMTQTEEFKRINYEYQLQMKKELGLKR
jgi:hypothetical protein